MKELGKHVKIIVSDTLPNKLNNQDNNRHFEVELNSLIQFKHKYFNIKFVGKKKTFFRFNSSNSFSNSFEQKENILTIAINK